MTSSVFNLLEKKVKNNLAIRLKTRYLQIIYKLSTNFPTKEFSKSGKLIL